MRGGQEDSVTASDSGCWSRDTPAGTQAGPVPGASLWILKAQVGGWQLGIYHCSMSSEYRPGQ